MRGRLSTNLSLTGNASIPRVVHEGGASSWNEISGKPFSSVDTTGGLTIYDNTLGIDTLDTIATIDYVDQQIDGVTTTLDDYALKSEIPDVSSFITADALTPYVESSELASVATSGDYEDLLNKPTIPTIPTDVSAFNNDAGYITDSALTPYVQSSALTTVAYSGDYEDLINKPTIPAATSVTVTQTLSSGTEIGKIDVDGLTTTLYAPTPTVVGITNTLSTGIAIGDLEIDGVTTTLYAPEGGGSEPDEKSIITNAQDKLEEAVPLYSEVISTDVGDEGLLINNYRYNGTTDGDFYLDTNENQLTFVSEATGSNDYYKVMIAGENGWIIAKWRNTVSITNNAVIESASSNFSTKVGQQIQVYYRYQQDATLFPNGNHYGVKFHIYSPSYLVPYSQWTNMSIYPTEAGITAGDTLETQAETLGLNWGQGQWVIYEYHKLPNEYLNLKSDEILYSGYYPMLYNDASGNIRAKRLSAGFNMSLATINLADGTQGYQFNCTLKESPVGGYTNGDRGSAALYMSNFEDISGGNPFKRRYYTTQSNWNNFFNNAGSDKDLVFSLNYCTSGTYYNNGPKITGIFHLGATNTDQPVIEGFEEIIDSYYIDTTNTTKYFCIELKDGYNIGFSQNIMMLRPATYYPAKANINSFFLPIDNSTIVRDTTNGNIKTAIPVPPTTDGTYTLQVTVSDGVVTYNWV